MTKYQVFRKVSGEDGASSFVSLGEYDGNDPKSAVRAAVLALPEEQRTESAAFAACASSSWQELTPKVKVETAVTFT